jgi:hypothetical protein
MPTASRPPDAPRSSVTSPAAGGAAAEGAPTGGQRTVTAREWISGIEAQAGALQSVEAANLVFDAEITRTVADKLGPMARARFDQIRKDTFARVTPPAQPSPPPAPSPPVPTGEWDWPMPDPPAR